MSSFKIALLLSYICIASISASIITPALPQIEAVFSLKNGAIEWIVAIFLFGYVIGQLVYGPLANRFGRITALRSGLVINIIGILICITANYILDYNILLLGRFLTALGSAAGLSCTFMLINELLSVERAKQTMSFTVVSFTVGIGLAITAGGIVTQYLNWSYCFWGLLIHGALMLIFTWQFPETLKQSIELNVSTIISRYVVALRNKNLLIFSLAVGFVSAVSYCYSVAGPIYAQTNLNLTPDLYAYWNLLNIIGMLCSGYLSAYLMKKYSPEKILSFGLLLLAPCLLFLALIAFIQNILPLWFFINTMFLYLFSGVIFPAGSYLASNTLNDKASASSMMSFINMSSAMLAVIFMSYVPLCTISSFSITLTGFYFLVISLLICNRELL
ncbi:MAG: MFS transporter [Gammaproteobacteria bacterium]|nr:MFS transporter [Gammaproteobacteria bacterium]